MSPKISRIYTVIAILALASLACGLPFSSKKTTAPASDQPKTTATTSANTATLQPGERYDSPGGGFSLIKVPKYTFTDTLGIVTMLAPDGNQDTGPIILVMGGLNKEANTNEEMLAKFKDQNNAIQITSESPVTLDGKTGIAGEVAGTQNGTKVRGRVVIVMATPYQQFTAMAIAPEDRWEKELAPLMDAVMASIKFIEPEPLAEIDEEPTQEPTQEEKPTIVPSATTETKPGEIRQWAKTARASSQYGNDDWSAKQATGAPNTDQCGDHPTAWASANSNGKAWLELTYETPVVPTQVNIYQSYNPSQVVEVQLITTTGKAYSIYSGAPEEISICPDEASISLDLTKKIVVNKVKIFIDQSKLGLGWNEIDAVELVGTLPEGASQQPPAQQGQSTGGQAAAGGFSYEVKGQNEDRLVQGSDLQYQSTSKEYAIGLLSSDNRYAVTLFLPLQPAPGNFTLKPYDKTAATQNPSAAVFIGAWFYYAQEGTLIINAVNGNKISGSFSFTAGREDDSSKVITVTGTFNQIAVK